MVDLGLAARSGHTRDTGTLAWAERESSPARDLAAHTQAAAACPGIAIAEKKDDYKKFYEQFGKNLKLGIDSRSGNWTCGDAAGNGARFAKGLWHNISLVMPKTGKGGAGGAQRDRQGHGAGQG